MMPALLKYDLFLFDADDTLFDFRASEAASFMAALSEFGVTENRENIFATYRQESAKLWRQLELGEVSKDFVKVERFRRTVDAYDLSIDHEEMCHFYLRTLPSTVHLKPFAEDICEFLSSRGQIGIVTNGIETVQRQRLERSAIQKYIHFMVVSEECGFVKPDRRIFDYALTKTSPVKKERILVVGDRWETDILGAHAFGVDACWYFPSAGEAHSQQDSSTDSTERRVKYQIRCLSELKNVLRSEI